MEFVVESGIPMPKLGAHKAGLLTVMKNLEIGQSIRLGDERQVALARSYQSYLVRRGKKFAVRKFDATSYRVWRLD